MRGQPATAGRGQHFETILDSSKFHSEQITLVLTMDNNTHFTYFFNCLHYDVVLIKDLISDVNGLCLLVSPELCSP